MSIKKWLPIQEPTGHGMSLEEYEQWRAQQGGLPTTTVKKEEEAAATSDSDDDVEPPSMDGTVAHPFTVAVCVVLYSVQLMYNAVLIALKQRTFRSRTAMCRRRR